MSAIIRSGSFDFRLMFEQHDAHVRRRHDFLWLKSWKERVVS